jgi:hypothetical protein
MPERALGYLMFVLGLAVIVLSTVSIFLVFTGKMPPISLFKATGFSLDTNVLISANYLHETPGNPLPQKIELIPASVINQTSNLTAHLILVTFIAGIGYKIALLGTQLLRPIQIKVRTESPTPPPITSKI